MPDKSKKTKSKVQKVWEKGKPIPGKNPDKQRRDSAGNEIRRSAYGKTTKDGWEKDHIHPKSKGGSDKLKNLQPLQSDENRRKSDKTGPLSKKKKAKKR